MTGTWDPKTDILAEGRTRRGRPPATLPEVAAAPGMSVRHRSSGFSGVLVRLDRGSVEIRDRSGAARVFRDTPGAFEVGGRAVALVRPATAGQTAPVFTASGSVAVHGRRARVARASRILVEGVHDAALVERVWGDDLRLAGIVVERLDGVDRLAAVVEELAPHADQRLGVLVDHLVPGSKEARLAAAVSRHPHVLVTGTPYVDVWEAIKPSVLGIPAWPQAPRGTDWKTEVCRRLAFPAPPETWRRILTAVRTYADLEPSLVGAVEQLIDFVSDPCGTD